MSTAIIPAHAPRVALSIYVILKINYVGNQGSRDIKLQVMMVAKRNVNKMLSVCYSSDFGLSEDESAIIKERRSILTEDHEL